jgi:predicted SAM-dependent methyltransferase
MSVVANLRRRVGTLLSPEARRFNACRRRLAARYLHGDGIEIGALHQPLAVPPAARVRYVDRLDVDGLRRHYPELSELPLVAVDVIDDGEALTAFADASVDFVIANHFIEHTQSPLATLRSHLRVLRPGGVVYLAVPDKRRTFDVDREVTPLEHVVRDLDDGPRWSRAQHFGEWARHVDHAADVEAHAAQLMADDYSIHFHVWTPQAFTELLDHARDALGMPFAVEELQGNGFEFIAILRRTPVPFAGDVR